MKKNFNTTYTFAKIYNEYYDTFSFGNIFFTKMLIPEGGFLSSTHSPCIFFKFYKVLIVSLACVQVNSYTVI